MRSLFLTACVFAGITTGLWYSGMLSFQNPWSTPIPIVNGAADQTLELTATPARRDPDAPTSARPGNSPIASTADAAANDTRPFSYHEGIMRVAPAVVSVYAAEPAAGRDNTLTSQGSGVIVGPEGIVLTNLHLVEYFNAITIVLSDGRRYAATLIGSDVETDLAVVKIQANMLPSLKLDEAKPLQVGDVVLAIGNPFGVGQTVTQGIVSATRRRIANGSVWQNFIQIDAAINPGNSGGALINPLGQLVGVNTAVFRGETGAVGIGFAIPAELLAQVVPQITENGSVSRGWLGLGVDDMNMFPVLRTVSEQGAVITSVQEGGPAWQTGVRPLDIVIRLGEQQITSATQLLLAVSALPPGATVKLALLRHPDIEGLIAGNQTTADSTIPMQEVTYKVRLGTRPRVNRTTPR